METKVIRATLVLTVMLLFLVGQSSASIKSCYHCCYDKCRNHGFGKVGCGYRCGIECGTTIPVPTCPFPPLQDESNCSFACAKSSCGHIDPGKLKIRLLASRIVVIICLYTYWCKFDALFHDRGEWYARMRWCLREEMR
jgi:hypothetical protein